MKLLFRINESLRILSTLGPLVPIEHCLNATAFLSIVQGSLLLFVTYIIIQGIIGSEMLIRTGPLNGKCKKNKIKIKHNNNVKAIKTMKQNTREYIYIYKYGENEIRDK